MRIRLALVTFASRAAALPNAKVTPASTPDRSGIANPDVTIESTLPNGNRVKLTHVWDGTSARWRTWARSRPASTSSST